MAGEHDYVLVDGLSDLIKGLRAFEGNVNTELGRALKVAAEPAATKAAMAAPKDDNTLAGSYHVKFRRGGRSAGVVVGSPLVYAPIVNFGRGAVIHGGKVRPHLRKLTPHEHVVTAVESSVDEIQAHTEHVLAAFLDGLIGND